MSAVYRVLSLGAGFIDGNGVFPIGMEKPGIAGLYGLWLVFATCSKRISTALRISDFVAEREAVSIMKCNTTV